MTDKMGRRRFIKTLAAAGATLSMPNVITTSRAANQIVFLGHGGTYQEGQAKALFEPFERETGIKVIQSSGVDLAKLRTQVQSKTVDWDLAPFADRVRYTAVRDGLLMPLDYSVINSKEIIPELVTEFGVGSATFSMALTYSKTAHPPGSEPKGWADYWDPKKIVGRRGMYNAAPYSLEFALIADGVSKDKLYPLDVKRAFKSLDRIKADVKVWWNQFPQVGVLLESGEVTMSPWTRSVQLVTDGKPFGLVFNEAAVTYDCWAVPKGAPNAANAMKFINWACDAKRQADVVKLTTLGPTNLNAIQYLDDKLKVLLPTYPENFKKAFLLSGDYWGANLDKVNEQWNEWRLS